MILRKPFLLRFRGVEQAEKFELLARSAGISLNEWILRRIENGEANPHRTQESQSPHHNRPETFQKVPGSIAGAGIGHHPRCKCSMCEEK